MDLYKFGIKLYLKDNQSYFCRDYISVFHGWIQNQAIPDHLLIDVADYSHVADGPGVMLIAHEGHFSLDQEHKKPGMMYMRKTAISGSFQERFEKVFFMAVHGTKLLQNDTENNLKFSEDSFRFIANDRRLAANTNKNKELFKKEIHEVLKKKFPNDTWNFSEISNDNQRLAFSVNFNSNVIILSEK